mgnify:CR=1 FL=1
MKETEKVDSSKLTDLDAVHNQNPIDVVKENNLITITKKAPLHSYLNDTETEEWILLILDFILFLIMMRGATLAKKIICYLLFATKPPHNILFENVSAIIPIHVLHLPDVRHLSAIPI